MLIFGVDYRLVEAPSISARHCISASSICRCACWCRALVSLAMIGVLQLYLSRTFIGRAMQAVAQDPLALRLMAADPSRIKRIAFGLSIATASVAGAILIIIQPVEPSIGRDYIGRIFAICVLGGLGSFAGTLVGGDHPRHRGEPDRDVLRPLLVAGGGVRVPAADPGGPAQRHVRARLSEQSGVHRCG